MGTTTLVTIHTLMGETQDIVVEKSAIEQVIMQKNRLKYLITDLGLSGTGLSSSDLLHGIQPFK
jgi:hypothetical protein